MLAMAACRPGSTGSGPVGPTSLLGLSPGLPSGPLVLRASPISEAAIRWITPLGNLNPPSHTLPTDHIYFYFAAPDSGESPLARRTSFAAPGDGTVTMILGGVGTESKVWIRQTATFTYYLDHLILTEPLTVGSPVTAGQVLGTTGSAYAVDLGVVNSALTLGFVNPSRYVPETLHADGPLKYFEEPVRGQLYAHVQRLGPDLDGRIDFDIAGRLMGNWFAGDSTALVFTQDTYDPSRVLIGLESGTMRGVFGIGARDPQPRDVSVESGLVLYTLTRTSSGPPKPFSDTPIGSLLVQMVDETHLRMETAPLPLVPAGFSGSARTFSR